jgi:FkbM family methyltransferase
MIKRILFKILGAEFYLRFVSRMFFLSFDLGTLKGKPEFFNHYFISKLISKDDVVIDIGANVGYYSVLFARLTGTSGKVLSVEPVELFRNVLKHNCRKFKQVKILPFALGEESGKQIKMGIPAGHKVFRHGLTRVLKEDAPASVSFQATMKTPSELFGGLEKLNFIKCDVEGYEVHILPAMLDLISKFLPVIQIETGGENRSIIFKMLQKSGYLCYYVNGDKLRICGQAGEGPDSDLIFIHSAKKSVFNHLIQ